MGWTIHDHILRLKVDSHGGERQEAAERLHADLMTMLRFEAACFLAWRDPKGELIDHAVLDGPGEGDSVIRW